MSGVPAVSWILIAATSLQYLNAFPITFLQTESHDQQY